MRRPLRLALFTSAALLPLAFALAPRAADSWTLVGWNNLGMHCMDSDYSVFSILPPFNVVNAHLIDANGKLVTDASQVKVTYEAVADPTGSTNSTSVDKTNYWTFAPALYGASGTPDTGLLGFDMPGASNTPRAMAFDAATNEFHADGIPITPFDDDRHHRAYPLMKLVARDLQGNVLATATPVLPVSDEMDCSACHASGSGAAAQPAGGWAFEKNAIRDYRFNILRLHDEKQAGDATFVAALATAGYSAKGLEDTVRTQKTPVLCARCHASNALPGTGIAGIPQLTTSTHAFHGHVIDPGTGLSLDDSTNRSSCYRCHPGSTTRCLRGAMGAAVATDGSLAIQCQNCHGNMSKVGGATRVGWLDQPNCQACHTGTATHNNGQVRFTDAYESDGTLRVAVDATFATNPDTPGPGFSLYRFSAGHGGLQCESCHGSTHAEFPATHPNDNLLSTHVQGHVGVLVECASCHKSTPQTDLGGPHGMHPVGQAWIGRHGNVKQTLGIAACKPCHGGNDHGSVLSRSHADRTLDLGDKGSRTFFKGQKLGCYTCHDGPNDDDGPSNASPVATDGSATCVDQPVSVTLAASDADGDSLTLRIVDQARFGRVGLSGTTATYIPDPGFAGIDAFTFAAWDGRTDSNLATVTVTRGATWGNYGAGYPGSGGAIPGFVLDVNPTLGAHVHFTVDNTGGSDAFAILVLSMEQAALTTPWGSLILTETGFVVPTLVPSTGLHIGATVPSDPAFTGLSEFLQVLELDAGAHFGVAFTSGLRVTLGQ
jgi:hypothetical protein